MRRAVMLVALCGLLVAMSGCVILQPRQAALSDAVAAQALDMAMSRIGDPYVWGGQAPGGFDCSGLIVWAYQQAYPALRLRLENQVVADATMDSLWRYNVVPVTREQMKPGDIVFITSDLDRITHGGLFIRWVSSDAFEFVNASSYAGEGEVLVDAWPIQRTKRDQWFVGAGRLMTTY